jgi:hypothetical protein
MLSKEETSRKIRLLPEFLQYLWCYVMFCLMFGINMRFQRVINFAILREF